MLLRLFSGNMPAMYFIILVIFFQRQIWSLVPLQYVFFRSLLASEVLTSLQDLRDQFIRPLIIPSLNPIVKV